MKTFILAAAVLAALKSSIFSGDLRAAIQVTSEPAGLVVWALALFATASTLKSRTAERSQHHEISDSDRPLWIAQMLRFGQLAGKREHVAIEAHKLQA